MDDVLSAPMSLIHENSKKVTEKKGGDKSLVKTIIIGAVPDRGGRTQDIRKTESSKGFRHAGRKHEQNMKHPIDNQKKEQQEKNKKGKY